MSIYYDKQIPGELWLRDLKNNVDSASNILSAFYLKYKNINETFYFYLNTNQVTRFDLFYDTIFIETPVGYILEKFYIQDEQILPFNQINLFNNKKTTNVDYWFNESKNTVIQAEIYCYTDSLKSPSDKYFDFILILKSFDCTTGLNQTIAIELIRLAYASSIDWDDSLFTVETPKITYNKDTKYYNVSFILRNSVKTLGLVSLNLLKKDYPTIAEVNGFLPYFIQDTLNSGVSSLKTLPSSAVAYYICTQDGYFLQTEVPEILSYDYI
jgi:hypothetical protein